MERKNKTYKPIYYKEDDDLDKPLSELMEQLRTDIAKVRGKLYDIKSVYGWHDRIEHIEGGLTCMISAMHSTMVEWKDFENKHLKNDIK